MNKADRQKLILKIISENEVETQDELTNLLNKNGADTAQPTVSRDIRELELRKKSTGSKNIYYYPSERSVGSSGKYSNLLKTGFVSCTAAGNLVVVKTVAGMAMAVAAALDSMNHEWLVGSIAGDDTIFCATKNEKDAKALAEHIAALAS